MKTTVKKYTVITGASAGIGLEAAKAFAARGKNLIIIARRKSKLQDLRLEILKRMPMLDIVVKVVDLSVVGNAYRLYHELKEYQIETWINNAGIGDYGDVVQLNFGKMESMLRLNVEAVAILSALYVRDYRDVEEAQLINLSSAGGYTVVPMAVTYCATKFFVSAFTEGLARELKQTHAKLQVKVLAPAATKTEFGQVASGADAYDYDRIFGTYHSGQEMASFLLKLYDSDQTVGIVDRVTFAFRLSEPLFNSAGN